MVAVFVLNDNLMSRHLFGGIFISCVLNFRKYQTENVHLKPVI